MYAPTRIDRYGEEYPGAEVYGASDEDEGRIFPYGVPGDRLWIRESFLIDWCGYERGPLPKIEPSWDWRDAAYYRADGECCEQIPECACIEYEGKTPWRSSIHMPRWASRITLEITDVRVQRIAELSEADVLARGFGWHVNPWVWAISFRRIHP
jgi:hypothetical protein